MQWLFEWLYDQLRALFVPFWGWLVDAVKAVFGALWEFVTDAFIALVDLVLTAVVAALGLIPVPDVISQGLGSLWAQLDGGIMWLATQAGVPQAMAMFGAAYLFRMGRKVVTLFQW